MTAIKQRTNTKPGISSSPGCPAPVTNVYQTVPQRSKFNTHSNPSMLRISTPIFSADYVAVFQHESVLVYRGHPHLSVSDSRALVYDDASLAFQICNQLLCCARPSRKYHQLSMSMRQGGCGRITNDCSPQSRRYARPRRPRRERIPRSPAG